MKRLVLFTLLLFGVVAPAHPHVSVGLMRRHRPVSTYVPPAVIPADLLAYWSFDASNAVDDTGHGHTGTATGATFGTPAKVGAAAAQFPGSAGNKIAFTTIALGSAAWAVQVWGRPHTDPGSGFTLLLGAGSGSTNGLYYLGGTSYDFFTTPGGDHFFGNTGHDIYAHMVVTQTAGGALKLYFNSVLISTIGGANVSFSPNAMGFDSATTPFNGAVDEVGIWNRELTQADVNFLYNSGSGVALSTPGFP